MHSDISNVALLRLLQLTSPALPVGAYAYSGGLEYVVAKSWVCDETSALEWIGGVLENSVCQVDVPIFLRVFTAWKQQDAVQVEYWSRYYHATRESFELQSESRHLGQAIARLLFDLGIAEAAAWRQHSYSNFASVFALAACCWNINIKLAVYGYVWAWCENQVAASIKLIPLGQTGGQRILSRLITKIPSFIAHGMTLDDDQIGLLCPGLAMASAAHETQYTRLFRS